MRVYFEPKETDGLSQRESVRANWYAAIVAIVFIGVTLGQWV